MEYKRSTPFFAYVRWLKGQDTAKAKEFWEDMFSDYTPKEIIVENKNVLANMDNLFELSEETLLLNEERVALLGKLSSKLNITISTLITSAWAKYNSERENSNDIICGIVNSGRDCDIDGIESMAGLFVNILPCRIRGGLDCPTLEWLGNIQYQQLSVLKYGYNIIHQIAKWGKVPANHINKVINEKTLVYLNYPTVQNESYQFNGINIYGFNNIDQISVPLRVSLKMENGRMKFTVQYNKFKYLKEYIDSMLTGMNKSICSIIDGNYGI